MPYKSILQDSELNKALQQNGYAIVPFLNDEEIDDLKSFFYQSHSNLPEGMYASSHSPDFDLRKSMNEKISEVIQRASKEAFKDSRVLGATFMVKSKGQNGVLQPHQDWNIVDETKFNSYNIWLPLVDTDSQNGTLLILPNSHNLFSNIRGLNIPSSFENVIEDVWQYLVPIDMKVGEALVYDHRLLHASSENKKDTPRLVIVSGLVPATAEMRYYYGCDGKIETYACTPEFYFNQDINSGPKGLKLLSSEVNSNVSLTKEDLKSIYNPSKSFFQKLLDLFN